MNIFALIGRGGPAMWPLLLLSILSLGTIIERIWFWSKVLNRENEVAVRVLESAQSSWQTAADVSRQARPLPMGRVLNAPFRLKNPDPEVFRLALETAANEEVYSMRRGEKLMEAVIALGPLLGLLGTVLGLISSLGSIRLGELGTDSTSGVTLGIGEALITTATGLIIAITTLVFYRVFQSLVFGQAKAFQQAGSELEVLYRQDWAATNGNPMAAPLAEPPASES